MKSKLVTSAIIVSIAVVSGCAGTGGGAASTSPKEPKALTAADIVARYRQTLYGKDGVAKHSSMTVKGTLAIEQFGLEGPVVRYAMAPDSNVTNIEIMGMTLSNGCHKSVCWAQQPGAGTMTLSGDAATMQLQQADWSQWEHMDRYYASLTLEPPADGKESPEHRIKAVRKNGDTDYYEFSKETGLLTGAIIEGDMGQGRMQVSIAFRNYKEFDGWMMPTELEQATPQATIKLKFNEVTYGPIAPEKFNKPN